MIERFSGQEAQNYNVRAQVTLTPKTLNAKSLHEIWEFRLPWKRPPETSQKASQERIPGEPWLVLHETRAGAGAEESRV